jgi:hypothetical protein
VLQDRTKDYGHTVGFLSYRTRNRVPGTHQADSGALRVFGRIDKEGGCWIAGSISRPSHSTPCIPGDKYCNANDSDEAHNPRITPLSTAVDHVIQIHLIYRHHDCRHVVSDIISERTTRSSASFPAYHDSNGQIVSWSLAQVILRSLLSLLDRKRKAASTTIAQSQRDRARRSIWPAASSSFARLLSYPLVDVDKPMSVFADLVLRKAFETRPLYLPSFVVDANRSDGFV